MAGVFQLIIVVFLFYAIWVFVSSHRRLAVTSEEIAASLRKKFEADHLADEAKAEVRLRRRVDEARPRLIALRSLRKLLLLREKISNDVIICQQGHVPDGLCPQVMHTIRSSAS